ncbi:asparagine synthase (glutamine-hydrolyzing) [Streptosporangium roseum]|uniref:asparagine synthase (glutamine-hydrolyzing) n=1 Tax=Streptosporangium roseum TaxID=2001 RepID=UPI0004CD0909|nr:asparagine synthase (glutamine-hydrolyzing) [Streptosporangium roseum]
MSEIAGWVDFEREPATAGAVVTEMTRALTMGECGDPRLWSGPGGALALRDARSPGPAGRALRDARGARGPAVIAFGGACDNRAELRGLPGRPDGRGDAAAVLHAYRVLGDRFTEHLRGSYAFALWEPQDAALTLVRDRLGTRPLYYLELATGVVFASRPEAVLAHPAAHPALDEDGLRIVLSGIAIPGRTVYRDVREVRPGHTVRFSREGRTERRYWALSAAEHRDDTATTVARVRELLEEAVGEQTADAGRAGSLMSGGLDSSALAALLAGRREGRLATFSVDYQGYEENFRPHIVRPEPDSPYVRDMTAHLGSDHTDVVLTTGDLTAPDVWNALVAALDQPRLFADTEPSMILLYRAVRGRLDTVLSGEGADELFGGFPWFHHPRWAEAPDFPWTPTTDELVGTLFAPAMRDLAVPDFRAEHYREALAELPAPPDEDPRERRMREVGYLFVTRFLPEQLDRAHRLSAGCGFDVRMPFCDHRLVEYALNIPWGVKNFDGSEKSVLRAAAADLLPASVLERRKSGYPMTHDQGYDRILRAKVGELAAGGPVLPLLDASVLERLREDPSRGPALSRTELELALKLDAWLTRRRLALPH